MSAVVQAFLRLATRVLPGSRAGHPPDYWLLTTVLMLLMFGTVMVFSASFAIGIENEGGNSYYFLTRQVIWVTIGLAALLVTMNIDYHVWRRLALPGMLLVLILLAVVVLVPAAGTEAGGATRWIPLGPLSFQPSEVAKPIVVIYLAEWLSQKGAKVRDFSYGLVPFAIYLGLLVGLVMLQPDLGTSAVLASIGIGMFLVAGADLVQFSGLIATGGVAFLVLALGASYRRARILIFLNPDADPLNLGWQLKQARLALGSGGIFGLGLGASRQKFAWLPAAQNDAIFAVIGEELGLIGCSFVLLLFLALAWRGYRVATKAPDAFGSLVGVGIVTWIIFQAAINIGGITMTIPFTGVPLPFISYGGTSLAVSLAAIGILLNISRHTIDQPVVVVEERPSRSQHSGSLLQRFSRGRRTPSRVDPELQAPRRSPSGRERGTTRPPIPLPQGRGSTPRQSGSFGRAQTRRPPRTTRHWK